MDAEEEKIVLVSLFTRPVNLMLEGIRKFDVHVAFVAKDRTITVFIYKHSLVLNSMRALIKGRELIRPNVTHSSVSSLPLKNGRVALVLKGRIE